MTNDTRKAMVLLALAFGVSGCMGKDVLTTPRAPTTPTTPTTPATPAAPAPIPPMSLTAITPSVGSTGGATPLRISGTGFRLDHTVRLDGQLVQARSDPRDPIGTILYLEAPAHAAGAGDVVVASPNGQVATLVGGYTWALPQSFDFNGKWSGFGNAGQDIPILFTIQNNMLVSVSCDTHATLTFSTPPLVTNGEFSYSRGDGITVSGRIVSATDAVGTLNLPPCSATNWGASK